MLIMHLTVFQVYRLHKQKEKKKKEKKKSMKFVVCTFFFFIQSGLKEAVNRNCKSHKGETNGTIIFHYTFPRRGNTVAS